MAVACTANWGQVNGRIHFEYLVKLSERANILFLNITIRDTIAIGLVWKEY